MKYPKYVRCCEYIGIFTEVDHGFPCYRFPGGERVAGDDEIRGGSDDRAVLEKQCEEWKKKYGQSDLV